MIKTLSDYNLLESEEWKDSINTLFLELRSKLPEFFKEVPLPTIPHEDYVEVVIPASKQVMMEDLVEWLEKKLGLHILYASKQNYGKLLKAAAYSTSVPFVFHYCIKPKAASSDKWRNFYSFLSARMPWLKRKALAVKAWISYIYITRCIEVTTEENSLHWFLSFVCWCFRWWTFMQPRKPVRFRWNGQPKGRL